uniref:ACB domain-containing protein n=1 Tax=Kwoniella dejecticola CBS 10117 TaxID=1296121 RepID=A0A1A5ZTQ4_9TREE|nr:uncharacterized protein I303_08577 [Kwoniella dejecticola CBS 10117]OBR81192.1 hypothetical protein I303_08577 [Kwoniella dejecticola CBS 10117]
MSAIAGNSQKEFIAASSWLSSAPSAASLSTDLKLELYGLFKYVNASAGPEGSRPSIFSPAPRAKHDAWAAQHAKYSPKHKEGIEMARQRYMAIAKQIGWNGDGEEDEDEVDLENLDDSPFDMAKQDKGKIKADNPIGGVKVSVMSGEEEMESANPLHDAVSENDIPGVQALLRADSAAINSKDAYGFTPLHLSADRGHVELTKLLLQLGADKNITDEDDQTPLMLAEISGRDEIVHLLK